MQYSPSVLGGLFLDNEDYEGLLFWYEHLKGILGDKYNWPL